MTAIYSRIRADLRRILLGVPGLPAAKKYEGKEYKPVVGTPYVSERIDPVGSTTDTLAALSGGQVGERGIYAVDLWTPPEPGINAGEDLADTIRAAFWHGRAVGGPDFHGWVETAEKAPMLESPGWLHYPIRVTFLVRRPVLMA